LAGVAAVVALSLAACGGSKSGSGSVTDAASDTPAATSSAPPSSTPPRPPAVLDPLTGGKFSTNRVLAVKIDDTENGRPQFGLDEANIVYVEQVEGGLTRLIAVFHTSFPNQIGPVRSVRANDPQVLGAYGAIGFAASGGGGDSLPTLDASPLVSTIHDRGGPGFFMDYDRSMPYNTMLNPNDLPAKFGAGARPIGFTWSPSTAQAAAAPAGTTLHTVVGGTDVNFAYLAGTGRYLRTIGGVSQQAADGKLITTPNVIVQFCVGYTNPNDVDVDGNPGHFTKTIGHGKVVVFRNGHAITGTWTRGSNTAGTTLTAANGAPIALAPGGAWVLLVTNGTVLN
jgi:hypothetical protein